jgi:ornithine cyclodeaminase
MSNSRIDFLYLSENDMIQAGVKDMDGCIETMEDMLKLLKVGDYRMGGENGNSHGVMMTFPEEEIFPGMPTDSPDRRFMAMPAYLGGEFQTAGMKWYGSNIENKEKMLPRSILMLTLNDKDTGAPLAHMSANVLSAYRTGAIPGVGMKYLAKEDATVVGIIGPGVINRTGLAAAISARPAIDTIKVKGRSQRSMDDFIDFVHAEFPHIENIIVVDKDEDAVRDCDIVCICTSCPTGDIRQFPLIEEEWLSPGTLLCCPAAARFDDDFYVNRARHVVDNIALYEAWAEEYPYPTFETIPIPACHAMDLIKDGKMSKDQIDDIADILTGEIPVHRNEGEVIIYSIGGMPIEDVAWGTKVYRNALKKGIGTKLNLWEEPLLA